MPWCHREPTASFASADRALRRNILWTNDRNVTLGAVDGSDDDDDNTTANPGETLALSDTLQKNSGKQNYYSFKKNFKKDLFLY